MPTTSNLFSREKRFDDVALMNYLWSLAQAWQKKKASPLANISLISSYPAMKTVHVRSISPRPRSTFQHKQQHLRSLESQAVPVKQNG